MDYQGCLKYVGWLREQYPRNSFFHALEGRVYAKWNEREDASRVFGEVLDAYMEGRPGYNDPLAEQALYYLARLRMLVRDYDGALTYLVQLEALSARASEDTYFKVMGRLRQGMSYDALGKRALATTRYREVLKMKSHARSHDRAETYLKKPYRG